MTSHAARVLALVIALGLPGCASGAPPAAAPVSAAQAQAAVERAGRLAARQTEAALRELCAPDRCVGLSSAVVFEPARAPGADRRSRQLCSFALPPTEAQRGARMVVLEGTSGDGRRYVTQVLVERDADGVFLHEPAFWLGIRYTSLRDGRAWSGASDDPAQRARDSAAALRACNDRRSWLTDVTGA